MAKKTKELTLEEKLEQALVPEEEWPYEVPENWCLVKIASLFKNVTSSTNKLKTKDYLENGKIPIVDQGQMFIGGYSNDIELSYKGALPVVVFGDHTRCVKYIDARVIIGLS